MRFGTNWYVRAHCRLPQPNTANGTPASEPAARPSIHDRNFFALSGACPSYDAVTAITGVPAGSASACSSSAPTLAA